MCDKIDLMWQFPSFKRYSEQLSVMSLDRCDEMVIEELQKDDCVGQCATRKCCQPFRIRMPAADLAISSDQRGFFDRRTAIWRATAKGKDCI
jgi:hypothetical protein